ncbi:PREDICTED: small cysteine-rich protein 3-like [Acropora digitifera]|uniref:small cysteine-rich protein 3-like n=1 Tax=Acropora digitifera TaxID=70779 RepID=UPI00077AECCD|nr:PREDICTED: small cysteine-rich protein 3-like [Acropora digitifera]
MGVSLNICLLMLMVATISSQGSKLRVKDDSKDEQPFGIYRRASACQQAGGLCIRSLRLCKEGFRACPKFEGCPDQFKCCCPKRN